MNPESLTIQDAYVLNQIMKNKAKHLNTQFQNSKWTPRLLDKVLWSIDRSI